MEKKLAKLKKILSRMESVLVAFSGGVDSTFLLKVACEVLKDKVVAATANSEIYPISELEEAKKRAQEFGVKHIIIHTDQLSQEEFIRNTPRRCYFCKKELFSKLKKIAKEENLNCIIDASNYDDIADFRPGREAGKELGIRSPLEEAKLTKEDIRSLSHRMRLPTWNKPSLACLATRIPYRTRISKEKLKRIGEGEKFLKELGMRQVRLRDHGDIARIEIAKEEMILFLKENLLKQITDRLKKLGYTYITLDIEGYRTGSMNEILKDSVERVAYSVKLKTIS